MGVEDILTQKGAKLLDNSFLVPMHSVLTSEYNFHFEQVGNDLHQPWR